MMMMMMMTGHLTLFEFGDAAQNVVLSEMFVLTYHRLRRLYVYDMRRER